MNANARLSAYGHTGRLGPVGLLRNSEVLRYQTFKAIFNAKNRQELHRALAGAKRELAPTGLGLSLLLNRAHRNTRTRPRPKSASLSPKKKSPNRPRSAGYRYRYRYEL
jgi:hypothetical protein